MKPNEFLRPLKGNTQLTWKKPQQLLMKDTSILHQCRSSVRNMITVKYCRGYHMRDQSPKNEVHTFIREDEIKKKRLFYVAKIIILIYLIFPEDSLWFFLYHFEICLKIFD